jgi:integrase
MRIRLQKGHLYRKGGWWYVRYSDPLASRAANKRKQVAERLVPSTASRKEVQIARRRVVERINELALIETVSPSLSVLVERYYLPTVERENKPSTFCSYRNLWNRYLRDRFGSVYLTSLTHTMLQRFFAEIATNCSASTRLNIKHFLSGAMRFAIEHGYFSGENLVHKVSVKKGSKSQTEFYSIEEVSRMLGELPVDAAAAVALAAYVGLRKSEIRGLKWSDVESDRVWVRRSVWHGRECTPKCAASEAAVPLIATARNCLSVMPRSGSGWVFVGLAGLPADLDNVARRRIVPVLKRLGLKWKGWHAFRRGLATTLCQLGVDLRTMQAILRHSDPKTTMRHYVKYRDGAMEDAMRTFESQVCTYRAPEDQSAIAQVVVMQ